MVVRKDDSTTKIHLSEIACVVLQTTQAYLSAYLLAELAKSKISLITSDQKSNPIGQYLPLYGAHNCSGRIRDQLDWGEPIKKRVWQAVVKEKILQQELFLHECECENAVRMLKEARAEVRSGDTTNREGQAARVYFSALFGSGFTRDADCPINAALNFGYSVLLSMVNREIVSRGYLTQVGICHRSEYNQFNLACDLMEPFRPVYDRLVVDSLQDDLNRELRFLLIDAANRSLLYRGGSYRLSSVVSLYVQDCLNALNKQIAVDDIEGFRVP